MRTRSMAVAPVVAAAVLLLMFLAETARRRLAQDSASIQELTADDSDFVITIPFRTEGLLLLLVEGEVDEVAVVGGIASAV